MHAYPGCRHCTQCGRLTSLMVHLLLANARASLVLCRAQQCVPLRYFTTGESLIPSAFERGRQGVDVGGPHPSAVGASVKGFGPWVRIVGDHVQRAQSLQSYANVLCVTNVTFVTFVALVTVGGAA
jgi:hypothetical protein